MKDERALLEHIRQAIDRVELYANDGEEAFMSDIKTQDAVIRSFEIIGEAAKGLSQELKDQHAHIPWKQITGMRDFLIHVYFGVNLERVWQTTQNDLTDLRTAVVAELN